MFQQESIYNLLPKSKILKRSALSYKSIYPYSIPPTASTFNLHTTSFPNIINCNGDYTLPRGAHEIKKETATFGLPLGSYASDPQNFHKKGETYRILPPLEKLHNNNEIKKPPIPKIDEIPLHGLKTEKNFIIANAVDNILMKPKINRSASQDNNILHKFYGKVPNYIIKFRNEKEIELNNIKEANKRKQEEEDAKQRLLSKEEVENLREGLKKKWEMYSIKYGKISHKRVFDNIVLLRK